MSKKNPFGQKNTDITSDNQMLARVIAVTGSRAKAEKDAWLTEFERNQKNEKQAEDVAFNQICCAVEAAVLANSKEKIEVIVPENLFNRVKQLFDTSVINYVKFVSICKWCGFKSDCNGSYYKCRAYVCPSIAGGQTY